MQTMSDQTIENLTEIEFQGTIDSAHDVCAFVGGRCAFMSPGRSGKPFNERIEIRTPTGSRWAYKGDKIVRNPEGRGYLIERVPENEGKPDAVPDDYLHEPVVGLGYRNSMR